MNYLVDMSPWRSAIFIRSFVSWWIALVILVAFFAAINGPDDMGKIRAGIFLILVLLVPTLAAYALSLRKFKEPPSLRGIDDAFTTRLKQLFHVQGYRKRDKFDP